MPLISENKNISFYIRFTRIYRILLETDISKTFADLFKHGSMGRSITVAARRYWTDITKTDEETLNNLLKKQYVPKISKKGLGYLKICFLFLDH